MTQKKLTLARAPMTVASSLTIKRVFDQLCCCHFDGFTLSSLDLEMQPKVGIDGVVFTAAAFKPDEITFASNHALSIFSKSGKYKGIQTKPTTTKHTTTKRTLNKTATRQNRHDTTATTKPTCVMLHVNLIAIVCHCFKQFRLPDARD